MALAMEDMRSAAEDASLTLKAIVARADMARAMGKYGTLLWTGLRTRAARALCVCL